MKTIESFIEEHGAELRECIGKHLNHVPRTASCTCPRNGTDHYHDDAPQLDDDELRDWILNDEGRLELGTERARRYGGRMIPLLFLLTFACAWCAWRGMNSQP